jgi:hypothetical protein
VEGRSKVTLASAAFLQEIVDLLNEIQVPDPVSLSIERMLLKLPSAERRVLLRSGFSHTLDSLRQIVLLPGDEVG